MNKIKTIVGFLMILGGIVFGLYVGFWVCFIGGIIQIFNEIKSPEAIVAMNIVWGLGRIFFAAILGWLAGLLLVIPGIAMIKVQKKKK